MNKTKQFEEILSLIEEVGIIEKNFIFYHLEGKKISDKIEGIVFSKQNLFPEGQNKLKKLKLQFSELVTRYNKDMVLANNIINKVNNFFKKYNNPMRIKGLEDLL